jgi:hypothetical protein
MLFRSRIVGAFIGVVGLVFTVVGIALVATSGWTKTEATVVGQCTVRSVSTGTSSSRHVAQNCAVTWQDGGVAHTGRLDIDQNQAVYPGTRLTVAVSGNQVMMPSPLWVRIGTLILGLALLLCGVVIFVRAARNRAKPIAMPLDAQSPVQPG